MAGSRPSITSFRLEVAFIHPAQFCGRPLAGQEARAAANASCMASSAASKERQVRIRAAIIRPECSRKTDSTASVTSIIRTLAAGRRPDGSQRWYLGRTHVRPLQTSPGRPDSGASSRAATSTASFRTAADLDVDRDGPESTAVKDTRQAFTIALVKPGRASWESNGESSCLSVWIRKRLSVWLLLRPQPRPRIPPSKKLVLKAKC